MTTRVALIAVAVFLGAWAAVDLRRDPARDITDTPVYESYGDAMAAGEVPYRDFRPEYPPGALPAFVVPSLVEAEPELPYDRAFRLLMAGLGAVLVALLAGALAALRAGPARYVAALAFAAVWPLLLGPVALTRFDLWPAALTAGALAAFVAGRDRLGSGVLGAAVAAKLFPAVLAPLAAVWVWRRRGRRAALACGAVFAGVLAAAFVPFAVLGAGGLGGSLERQLSRPLQIESLGAALLVAVRGADVDVVSSYGSQNVGGSLAAAVGAASTGVQLGVLVAVWLAFAGGQPSRERLVRFAALALVVLVAFGKVLSPQFLIWLVPAVPLVAGRRGVAAGALLAAALLLTQGWFPYSYWDYARDLEPAVTALVVARDVVLVALAAVLASAPTRGV